MARAVDFYTKLLGVEGISFGDLHYLDCGGVVLALVATPNAEPLSDHLYFSVPDLEAVHARAAGLGCLSDEQVHGESAGEIVRRPWGERSFYVNDPFGNPLCFVDEESLFTGR